MKISKHSHGYDIFCLNLMNLGRLFVAPFNNMRTLKFKAQPTNAFFATVNQMFGGSSQLTTMLSELSVINDLI